MVGKQKIISINLGNFGSTGKIMKSISAQSELAGFKAYMVYPQSANNVSSLQDDYIICSDFFRKVNEKLAFYTGMNGCFAIFPTVKLIRFIKKINPSIIHFHNLHNSYVNLPILFKFIKKSNVKVIWTLHDCWSFTGHCPHFMLANCNKWRTGCHNCPSFREYPSSLVDNTKLMWKLKKKWFTGVNNMTIVTPSQWLADLVKQSFLREYPVKVINNGIDLSIFRPVESEFREINRCENKMALLGVAYDWGKRKGLDVFTKLAEILDDTYQIILVGTTDIIDKELPNNIISIHKTNNQEELAKIYSGVDVFINPTREDNFPTVNIEALACGTPVITFNTGGSPEIIDDSSGIVVPQDDIALLVEKIRWIKDKRPFNSRDCIKRAHMYNAQESFEDYIELFQDLNITR